MREWHYRQYHILRRVNAAAIRRLLARCAVAACAVAASLAHPQAGLCQTDGSASPAQEPAQKEPAHAGLHGSVKAGELNGKASSMQEAVMDTPDEAPPNPPAQMLKHGPKLEGGIKRSSIFAKVHHPKMTA